MKHWLLALILSVALALWGLWPAVVDPSGVVVGHWVHPDCLSNHWLLVWVAEQVSHGGSILHNDRYYWPVGDAPVLAGNGNEGFFYLPFHLVWGWPVAVVPYLVAVLTLNGLAGFALGRASGAGPGASLIPAAVAGGNAYVLSELEAGRFSQASICWMLFFLAAWSHYLRAPSHRRAVLAGVLGAVTAFFYWYYAFFAALAGLALLAVQPPGRKALASIGTGVGTGLVLIAPWLWIFLSAWSDIPGTAESFPHAESFHDSIPLSWFQQMTPVAWVAGLVSLGLGRKHRLVWAWAAVWALFTVLAMGPHGFLYTTIYGLAEPLRRFWWPARHLVLAQVALGTVAAVALSERRWAPLVAVGACWGLGQVVISPAQLPPEPVVALGQLEDGIMVEPPLAPQAAAAQQQLIYQLYHHKTLLSGHALWVDRVRPEAWDEFMAKNSFLAALQAFERGQSDQVSFDPADLQALIDGGVRWFVWNREFFVLRLSALYKTYPKLFDALFGEPVIRDTGYKVWDARNWTGAHQVDIKAPWPAGLQPAGPEMPLTGRRPRSMVFTDPPEPLE